MTNIDVKLQKTLHEKGQGIMMLICFVHIIPISYFAIHVLWYSDLRQPLLKLISSKGYLKGKSLLGVLVVAVKRGLTPQCRLNYTG